MFHDKVWCHRFFRSFGVPTPVLVAEVENYEVVKEHIFSSQERDSYIKGPAGKLIWKPRYSTMGLGVEHFTPLETTSSSPQYGRAAPGPEPYVLEEFVKSTEYREASEWYRMQTVWDFEDSAPKPGYTWRTRNEPGDARVQTNIIGGAYCVTAAYTPFVGPKTGSKVVDPRSGTVEDLHKDVEAALTRAIALQLEMHKVLGKELYRIRFF